MYTVTQYISEMDTGVRGREGTWGPYTLEEAETLKLKIEQEMHSDYPRTYGSVIIEELKLREGGVR